MPSFTTPFVIPNEFSPNTLAQSGLVDQNFAVIAAFLNALGYMLPLPDVAGGATPNTASLTASLAAAAANGGGIDAQPDGTTGQGSGGKLIIPQYQYAINSSPGGIAIPDQVVMESAGYGGRSSGSANDFFHFVVGGSGSAGNAGNLCFTMTGDHTASGAKIERVAFKWNSTNSTDTAVLLSTWNGHLEECSFYNVPVIASFGQLPNGGGSTPGGLGCTLRDCTSLYGYGSAPDYATSVWMTGEQASVHGPGEWLIGNPGSYISLVAISMGGGLTGSEHQVLEGLHLADYNYGIDYSDINNVGISSGCQHGIIRDCHIQCFVTAINLSPQTNMHNVYNQKFFGNTLTKSHNATSGAPIFLVDTNSGTPANVAGIEIIGNLIYGEVVSQSPNTGSVPNNSYGLQINGGEGVKVIGNKIGNCGSNNVAITGCANIAITSSYIFPYNGAMSIGYPAIGIPPTSGSPGTSVTDGCLSIIIEGNDLRPGYAGTNSSRGTGTNGSGPSNYGIVISGTQNGTIQIRGNDLTGYGGSGSAPLLVTTTIGGTLEVTDNPGYNDQNTVISTVVPTSATSASIAAALGGSSINYWGPSNMEFVNGNSTGTTTLTVGAYSYVIPINGFCFRQFGNNTDAWFVTCTGGASTSNLTNFRWIGK